MKVYIVSIDRYSHDEYCTCWSTAEAAGRAADKLEDKLRHCENEIEHRTWRGVEVIEMEVQE